MAASQEYFKNLGWSQNPFTITISPDLMVGYTEQTETILSHILNFHKVGMVIGPTGSGKTTLLNWVNNNVNSLDDFCAYYVPKPPVAKEELVSLFKMTLGFNILDQVRFSNLSVLNIQKYLLKKTRKLKTVFLIDEAHECSIEVLEWVRTINDMIPNLMLIFAGLPTFEKKIESDLPTLLMRINTKVYLQSLNEIETEALVRKRIEKVGGKGIEPFTHDAITKIYEVTGGFPREIIKVCDQLVREAVKRNVSYINPSFVEQIFRAPTPVRKDDELRINLTSKQREILELLDKKPNISTVEISELLGESAYKSKSHAVRSVNNILRRLMSDELIRRNRVGTSYVYSLTGKTKTIFAEA